MRWTFALLLSISPLTALAASGDDYEDLDEPGGKRKPTDEEVDSEKPVRAELVREIERGFYLKSAIGSTSYLLTYGGTQYGSILRAGTSLSLVVGQDFVDNEKNSMAWEIAFNQGVHNGLNWQLASQGIRQGAINPAAAIQGDTRTFSGLANIEYSIYPNRRVGLGLRGGGGIMFAPMLLGQLGATQDVFPAFGSTLAVHQSPHPVFFGGPTVEYYTKLSHFSVGLDADVSYAIGFDLGVSTNGYMKFTF